MTLPEKSQMIVTLESGAVVSDIRKALKLIRGIASVRIATISDDHTITPAMRRSINKARREYAKGETSNAAPRRRCSDISTAYDRIIYDIYDDRVTVLVVQAEEHYNDK